MESVPQNAASFYDAIVVEWSKVNGTVSSDQGASKMGADCTVTPAKVRPSLKPQDL